MSENLEIGLQLLFVGMLSVFFILAVVIGLARILIYAVNAWAPEQLSAVSKKTKNISAKHLAVISATIDLITSGKGVVRSAKKL